mmetsp:Transcript_26171/g.57448  ORF Transcript_26171/g.57448 Transcript_26171/m.57448 type:complete len:373 (-) Transcript_26171:136-1254(-)
MRLIPPIFRSAGEYTSSGESIDVCSSKQNMKSKNGVLDDSGAASLPRKPNTSECTTCTDSSMRRREGQRCPDDSTYTQHDTCTSSADTCNPRQTMERAESLDLTHLQRVPEEEAPGIGMRLSELSISSRSNSQRLNESDRSGAMTTFTESTTSMQSFGSSLRSLGEAVQPGQPELDRTLRSDASCQEMSDSRHRVSFGNVEIKEYPRALGDNPACASGGPPLSLGWTPLSAQKLNLDEYETRRVFRRRKKEQMLVPPATREDWLRQAGYGSSEITRSIRSASRVKRQREKSNSTSVIVHQTTHKFKQASNFLKKVNGLVTFKRDTTARTDSLTRDGDEEIRGGEVTIDSLDSSCSMHVQSPPATHPVKSLDA